MQARMTILAIERELNHSSKSLKDDWQLDNENFDADIMLAALINKGASFEPLYSDPDYFYIMNRYFWLKWSRTFTEWFNAFDIEYNPLDNYDRHEKSSDSINDEGSEENTTSRSSSSSGTLDSTTTNTEDVTTTNDISAFDSSTMQPHDQNIVDNDSTSIVDQDTTDELSESGSGSSTNTYSRAQEHEAHIWGNIGVTTSSAMLKEYLSIREWNCYEHIADIYCRELCLTVY